MGTTTTTTPATIRITVPEAMRSRITGTTMYIAMSAGDAVSVASCGETEEAKASYDKKTGVLEVQVCSEATLNLQVMQPNIAQRAAIEGTPVNGGGGGGKEDKPVLSPGAIAGIAVAGVVVLGLSLYAGVRFLTKTVHRQARASIQVTSAKVAPAGGEWNAVTPGTPGSRGEGHGAAEVAATGRPADRRSSGTRGVHAQPDADDQIDELLAASKT